VGDTAEGGLVKPFKKRRRGGMYAVFESAEADMLCNLAGQLVELLRDRNGNDESSADPLFAQVGMGGPVLPPEDPVLKRLLPDAYLDNPEDAAEFRRFTEQSLTSAKVRNAETLIGSLVDGGFSFDESERTDDKIEVELDPEAVQAWLRSLTDIRIALAVRLGIDDDDDVFLVAASGDEATQAMGQIYDWLGFVQESLVTALG